MNEEADRKAPHLPDEQQVLDYLTAHPDFLNRHPQVLMQQIAPQADHGGNVLDFQHHMLGRLQESLRDLQTRYEGLIVSSRDNMSTQSQVHEAVLGLVKSVDLEALLMMLRQDLVQLFDVDVVRLALESPVAEVYEAQYGEHDYSGLSFIDPYMVDAAVGVKQECRLIPRVAEEMNDALRQVFADCAGLIQSAALLRLTLPGSGRSALLAFGVRHPDRFHPGQGVELLSFLARIVEYKLDRCLEREGLEEL